MQNVPKRDSTTESFYSLTYSMRSLFFRSLSQLLGEEAHKRERAKRTETPFCEGGIVICYVTRALSLHSLSQLLCKGTHKGERAKRTKK